MRISDWSSDVCSSNLSRDEGIHADRDVLLADAASLFTNVWLFDTLPKAMGLIAPMVYNSDGDELVFHSVRFPLATGVTQKAIEIGSASCRERVCQYV